MLFSTSLKRVSAFLCLFVLFAIPASAAPPANPVVFGTGWIVGQNAKLGEIEIYLPNDFMVGALGLDSHGNVINCSNTSFTAYTPSTSVYRNQITFPRFAYPQYRDNQYHDEYDLHLKVADTNCTIADTLAPAVSPERMLPYIMITLMGAIIVWLFHKH